ncbi:MAG: flavodoxin [Firmicutes bacterium]|nr:flavodoxin [Bacillota bacterium]
MKKITVIYWSGSGNTKEMAEAVAAGAGSAGAEVALLAVDEATAENVLTADAVALGCPAMGDEVLEEGEMEPFVTSVEGAGLNGKPIALFGSYDWGDGQWMREWDDRMKACGGQLVAEGLIAKNFPDQAALDNCKKLGEKLAAAV